MRRLMIAMLVAIPISGCTSGQGVLGPSQEDLQIQGQLAGAQQAVHLGRYDLAEQVLAQYVHRDEKGGLKLKYFGLSGENRKAATDIVVSLLWETGRDETLKQFASDYLVKNDYQAMLCRMAERRGQYEEAYQCWNKMGEADRAERVIRTEAAMRILGTQ